jgi:hypothetical protein
MHMSAAAVMGFEDVMAASSVEYDEVAVWGRKVAVMSITAGEVLEWVHAKETGDVEAKKGAGLLLLARSMCTARVSGGPDPVRLCDTPEKEQKMVEAFKLKDSKNVNKLVNRVLRMNGIIDDDDAGTKAVTAETAKND